MQNTEFRRQKSEVRIQNGLIRSTKEFSPATARKFFYASLKCYGSMPLFMRSFWCELIDIAERLPDRNIFCEIEFKEYFGYSHLFKTF